MARPFLSRLVAPVLVVALAGCGTGLLTGDPAMPPGSRQWIVTVHNESDQPVRLFVAEDGGTMGEEVGIVEPNQVLPNTTEDVVFTVPPGEHWAIFVNPTSDRGALILAHDVPPDVTGRLPVTIHVGPEGIPGAVQQGMLGPGWFGN